VIALAVRNELLMQIAKSVKLCEEVAKVCVVGADAAVTLEEIKALAAKGDTRDRSVLEYPDCGVMPFRDKVLAHPLSQIKALHGKEPYRIDLQWATVEATLAKIQRFADQVEKHNAPRWELSTYKE